MIALVAACRAREQTAVADRSHALNLPATTAWSAAIMPHDDYLYAAPVYLHLLGGLQARHWVLIGVCHACRRSGVRDRLIFDSFASWCVAGDTIPVATSLRADLQAALTPTEFSIDNTQHAAEHSLEALLPWLRTAVLDADIVPILVSGMSWPRMQQLADRLASALAATCRRRTWLPGRDIGILISADAVHYGCEAWGERGGYHPFGCDATGHVAARIQDITLAEATLAGPLTDQGLARFTALVWDPAHPAYPYRITWCGLYSIPFGLATAARLQADLELPVLHGHLLRYGDSLSDQRLQLSGTNLGVTAPNTVTHWVGYVALGYAPRK
jgi:AmmeMemoRadiSam system protein B